MRCLVGEIMSTVLKKTLNTLSVVIMKWWLFLRGLLPCIWH